MHFMNTPEDFVDQTSIEMPIANASYFLQAFASSPYVCQEKGFAPRAFQDPEDPNDQELHVLLWSAGQNEGEGEWIDAVVFWVWDDEYDDTKLFREDMNIVVSWELEPNEEVIEQFDEKFDQSWGNWVDSLQGQGLNISRRMHENADGIDIGMAYLTGSDDDEEKKTLTLICEDTWSGDGYDSEPRDGLTREEYALQVAERIANLIGTVPRYMPEFLRKIPELNQQVEMRTRSKPAPWVLPAAQKLGVVEIRSGWKKPGHGMEPDNYILGGFIPIKGDQYQLAMNVKTGVGEFSDRFDGFFMFPQYISDAFGHDQRTHDKQFEKWKNFAISDQVILTIFGTELSITWHPVEIVLAAVSQKDKSIESGWHFEVDEFEMNRLLKQGHTREQILGEVITLFIKMHPDLVAFAKSQR
jgi:hypothetical protein